MKNIKKLDPEKPEKLIDDITDAEASLHAQLVQAAEEVGKDRERWLALREPLAQAGREQTTNSEDAEIYLSAIQSLGMYRDKIVGLSGLGNQLGEVVSVLSASSDSTASITGTAITHIISHYDVPKFVFTPKVDENKVLDKLSTLDQSLAETYKAIDEVQYATSADPERGALYMMRQAFDHFFALLAPDKKVRSSRFWKKKNDEDVNRIERMERIRYVANQYVKNKEERDRLLTNAKHMIEVYQSLNRAHKRGPLDPEREKAAIREMKTQINDWVLIIELPSVAS